MHKNILVLSTLFLSVCTNLLSPSNAPIRIVSFVPGTENKLFVAIDADGIVKVCNAQSGQVLQEIYQPDVRAAALTAIERVDKTASQCRLSHDLPGDVWSEIMRFLPQQDRLNMRSICSNLREIHDATQKYSPCSILRGHSLDIWASGFSPDSKIFASVCEDEIRIWQLNENNQWACTQTLQNPDYSGVSVVSILEFSQDGKRIVIAPSGGGYIKILTYDDIEHQWSFLQAFGSLQCSSIAFSPTEPWFVAGKYYVNRYSYIHGDKLDLFRQSPTEAWVHTEIRVPNSHYGICCIKFSPDGQQILIGTMGGQIIIIDCVSMEFSEMPCISSADASDFNVIDITSTPNGIHALTYDESASSTKIWQFDAASWRCVGVFDGGRTREWHHANFNANGTQVLSWSDYGDAPKIYNVETGRIELQLETPGGICTATLSPDGKWLEVGQRNGNILMYAMPKTFDEHFGR